jgi:hypothetical protein
LFGLPAISFASTNINSSSTQHWAWNDLIGWIDFYNTNTITVSVSGTTGYASSSIGDISLDCNTTRIGNICGASPYRVLNDGSGNLSGWAWNDEVGWISFCGGGHGTPSCPGSTPYSTYIDSGGNFWGFAWNDAVGWIDFNCGNPSDYVCGGSSGSWDVNTSWAPTSTTGYLDSTTFDTGSTSGAQINSLIWYGNLPGGTSIGFQFAVSTSSSGPWNFIGPDGSAGTFYSAAPSTPISISYSLFSGYRYFRYRTTLTSDVAQRYTPQVNEVIVNWSP